MQKNNNKKIEISEPEGQLVLQTLAMPREANVAGDIFGGWIVSQMDIGGAILAYQCAQNRIVTVSIDKMVFLKPAYVGDLIACYASVIKTGRSSIVIKVQVWAKRMRFGDKEHLTEGIFTFVAVDEHGKSKPISWQVPR